MSMRGLWSLYNFIRLKCFGQTELIFFTGFSWIFSRMTNPFGHTLRVKINTSSIEWPLNTKMPLKRLKVWARVYFCPRWSHDIPTVALRNTHVSDSLGQQELRTAVLQLRAKQPDDTIFGKIPLFTTCSLRLYFLPAESVANPGWQAVLDLVKTVSESFSSSLHNFWAVSKSLIDGKLKRVGIFSLRVTSLYIYVNFQPTSSTRSPSQCRAIALTIVRHYISLISQTFMLSDVIIMTSPTSDSGNSRPPLLPVISNSLSTAYHLQRILAEVQDCVNDINSLDISTDVNQGMKNLLESVQWRFLDVLARDWLRGRGVHFCISSYFHFSFICPCRRESILSPRVMDFRTRRIDCYIVSFAIRTFSKTLDNRCL